MSPPGRPSRTRKSNPSIVRPDAGLIFTGTRTYSFTKRGFREKSNFTGDVRIRAWRTLDTERVFGFIVTPLGQTFVRNGSLRFAYSVILPQLGTNAFHLPSVRDQMSLC